MTFADHVIGELISQHTRAREAALAKAPPSSEPVASNLSGWNLFFKKRRADRDADMKDVSDEWNALDEGSKKYWNDKDLEAIQDYSPRPIPTSSNQFDVGLSKCGFTTRASRRSTNNLYSIDRQHFDSAYFARCCGHMFLSGEGGEVGAFGVWAEVAVGFGIVVTFFVLASQRHGTCTRTSCLKWVHRFCCLMIHPTR